MGAKSARPVVIQAMVAPLRAALRGLLAECMPAEAVEDTLGRLLARLRIGVEQLRPIKQLAPWMARVVDKVAGGSTSAIGEDRIAAALLPLLDLLAPEHAETLRLTDYGSLTQRAAAAHFAIPLVTLKSRIHSARRDLRRVVLAGLQLLAPDATDTATPAEPSPDTRAPRRRLPASSLLPAFAAGLEDLVRPWVPAELAPSVAASALASLRAALPDLAHNGRLPSWIYVVTRAAIPADSTGAPITTLPTQPTAEARSILAPAMRALLAGVPAEQVEALTLVDLEGRSQRKAAHHFGILPETFKQRLWRARRLGWQTLARTLTASRQPTTASPDLTALLNALQTLIQHLSPTSLVNPTLQRLLHQLHAEAPNQRLTSSLAEFLYATTLSSLQHAPDPSLPTPPTEPGPAERAALAACLAPLLATLTPEQSEAITLFDLDGLSLNSAAARVGIDRSTFQNRLQRARIRLRQMVATLARWL